MLWSVTWKNRQRSGIMQQEADDEQKARRFAISYIESKYYWQGPCSITACVPAANQGTPKMEPTSEVQQAEKYAFVRCWHPKAPLQVSIPIAIGSGLSVDDAARLLASVDNLLAAGWLPNEATLGEGEKVNTISHVVLMEHIRDGVVTPVVDLYEDEQKWKCLTVYLNTEKDQQDFETVSGLKLSEMQPYVGQGHIERGANPRLDLLAYKAARSFRVVSIPNPKHDPNETDVKKKKPKRLFERWADLKPPATDGKPLPASAAPNAQKTGGKSWATSNQQERIAAIMQMTDMMKLLEVRKFAGKLPMNEGKVYDDAVRDRAFQRFQSILSEAEGESEITDIVDSVKSENFGKFTEQQTRDLGRIADNRKQFLKAKK